METKRWRKHSFIFFCVGLVCWQKMKVCFVRWQKIELKNLSVGKKKIKNEALAVCSKRCRLLSMLSEKIFIQSSSVQS
jgi:hypothetical protein